MAVTHKSMRKKVFYKQKEKPRGIYSDAEKIAILAEYDRQVRAGDRAIPDIIASLDASPASIYRWLDQRRNIKPRGNKTGFIRVVENAIKTLCDECSAACAKTVEAIFIFIVWMRWPGRPDYLHLGVAAFLSAYYSTGDAKQSLSDLDDGVKDTLCSYIKLSDIRMLCCEAPFDVPLYQRYEIHDMNFDDGDVIATIAWVLINLGKNEQHPRKSASLNKSFYLIQEGCLEVNWIVGRRQLDKLWEESAPASPFLYTERYDSPLLFSLSPNQPDLVEYVNDLVSHPAEVRAFFGRSLLALRAILEVLDPRACKDLLFPTIPIDDPTRYSLRTYPLSDAIKAALKAYGRSSKYLR